MIDRTTIQVSREISEALSEYCRRHGLLKGALANYILYEWLESPRPINHPADSPVSISPPISPTDCQDGQND